MSDWVADWVPSTWQVSGNGRGVIRSPETTPLRDNTDKRAQQQEEKAVQSPHTVNGAIPGNSCVVAVPTQAVESKTVAVDGGVYTTLRYLVRGNHDRPKKYQGERSHTFRAGSGAPPARAPAEIATGLPCVHTHFTYNGGESLTREELWFLWLCGGCGGGCGGGCWWDHRATVFHIPQRTRTWTGTRRAETRPVPRCPATLPRRRRR
jgi:hypothetical protein